MCRAPRHADPYRHSGPSRAGLAGWLLAGLAVVLAGVVVAWYGR
jgi:hypothetical protein